MPTSWTNQAKSSDGTWTNLSRRSGATLFAGNPIGLLLSLTYAVNVDGETPWTNGSKSADGTWTNVSKS